MLTRVQIYGLNTFSPPKEFVSAVKMPKEHSVLFLSHPRRKEISSLAFSWEWGMGVMAKILKSSLAACSKTSGIVYLGISTSPLHLIPDALSLGTY